MVGVGFRFPVLLSKGVENYSKKINLLKREWVFFMHISEKVKTLNHEPRLL